MRGGIGCHLRQARVGAGPSREISTSVERDRPVDRGGLVGEVQERVRRVGRPVVVDEVRVGGVGLEGLVGVADTARHEDRPRRVELGGEHGAERRAFAQVDPRAEDPAGGDRDPLVPRLGVDAARGADGVVERDVVLHRARSRAGRAAGIFSRCQFSLNQPRASPCTGRSNTTSPGIGVSTARESLAELGHRSLALRWRRTPRRRPWRAPTRPRCRGTSRWSPRAPPRSRRTAGASRARCAACVESIA